MRAATLLLIIACIIAIANAARRTSEPILRGDLIMTIAQSKSPAVGVECDGEPMKAAFAGVAANIYGTTETQLRKQDIPYYVHTKFLKSAGDVMTLVRDDGSSPLAAVQLGEKKLRLNLNSNQAWAKASAVVAVAANLDSLPHEIVLTFENDNLKDFSDFAAPAVHHVSTLYGTEDEVPPRYNAEALWGEEGSDVKQVILRLDGQWAEKQEATLRRTERLNKLGFTAKRTKSAKYNREEEARESERQEEAAASLSEEEQHQTGAVDPFTQPGLLVVTLELSFNVESASKKVNAANAEAAPAVTAVRAATVSPNANNNTNTTNNSTSHFVPVGPFVRRNMSTEYIFDRQLHYGSEHKGLLAVINAIILVVLFIFIFATFAFGLGTPYAYEMGLRSKLVNYYPRAAAASEDEYYNKVAPTSTTSVTYDPTSPVSSPVSSPNPPTNDFPPAASGRSTRQPLPSQSNSHLPVLRI